MTIHLDTLMITLRRAHEGPGNRYEAHCDGGVLVVTEMPHRDRDRFVAVLAVDVDGVDAGIDYTVRASTLTSLDAALRKVTRSAAGADALIVMSVCESMKGRAHAA